MIRSWIRTQVDVTERTATDLTADSVLVPHAEVLWTRLACLDPLSPFLAKAGWSDRRIGSGGDDDVKICTSSVGRGRSGGQKHTIVVMSRSSPQQRGFGGDDGVCMACVGFASRGVR